MNNAWLGLIVLLASDRLAGAQSAHEVERHFRDAISTIGLTEKDLNFKKDVAPDRNLSPLVRTLLSKPLKTIEFVERLDQELAREPWICDRADVSTEDFPDVEDWKNTPPELRPPLRRLIGVLTEAQEDVRRRLRSAPEEWKQEALRAFAIENFHLDRDAASFEFWAARTGGRAPLKEALKRMDDLTAGETEWIEPQLRCSVGLNPVEFQQAARGWLAAIHNAAEAMRACLKSHPNIGNFDSIRWNTSLGVVVLGGTGSQVYRSDAVLIVDLGGDDRYERAGCAQGTLGMPFSVAIDLGGDDTYEAAATGVWGVGIVWDQAGNDHYCGGNASFGCGIFGAGILVDLAGDDVYSGDTLSQGAAAYGYGLLWDGDGDDRYSVSLQGQGFAGVHGYGALCDRRGDDRYFAGGKYPDYDRFPQRKLSLSQGFAMGCRPFAPGGLGALWDREGNDRYECDVYGQGSSYWYSAGVLIDGSGDDSYRAYQYDQGSGIHLSVGILKDASGNDRYVSHSGLAQAGCHDFAVGLLWEGGGNDSYTAQSSSQGSGIHNAVGLHYEASGKDRYLVADRQHGNGQGSGGYAEKRGMGGIGVLLDGEGRDRYSNRQINDHIAERPQIGVAADVNGWPRLERERASWASIQEDEDGDGEAREAKYSSRARFRSERVSSLLESGPFQLGRFVDTRPAVVPHSEEEILARGGDLRMGRLLLRAGRSGDAAWKKRDREKAVKILEAISPERCGGLVPWLGRANSMDRVVMDGLMDRKGKGALPILRKWIGAEWFEIRAFCLYWLGERGEASDSNLIFPLLREDRMRPAALRALSKLGVGERGGEIVRYLKSGRELERALAVQILGRLRSPDYEKLVPMLEDRDWNVRWEAAQALRRGGEPAWEALEKGGAALSPLGRFWAKKALIRGS